MASIAGQHLLSAVVEQVAGADTLSWELHPQQLDTATADTVTIDLSVPSLTPEQMSDIEAQCNAHIRAAHKIRQLVLDGSSKGQAERQKVIEKGNLRGKLPPADIIQVYCLALLAYASIWQSCKAQIQGRLLKLTKQPKHCRHPIATCQCTYVNAVMSI